MPSVTETALRIAPRALAAVCAALPAAAAQQSGGEAPFAEWECASCAVIDGWEIVFESGPAWVPDDDFRYGDYTGLDRSGVYLLGDLFARYRDADGRYAIVESYSRGESAYGVFAEAGRQGVFDVTASVQSIPRRFFDATLTPFADAGGANLTLPAGWVHAPTTAGMAALADAARPVEIGWDRTHYGLGFALTPRPDWALSVDYRRREREGRARASASVLFSALEFASPVDYATDDLEVALRYARDTWQASASYFVSVFDNAYDALTWDNPYTPIAGADRGRQALAPDNEAQRVSVTGSALLPMQTTLTGHLSIGRMTQDERLLPFTSNPSLAAGPLPAPSAGAAVDTTTFNLRAVSAPLARLTFEAEARYRDFDNETPIRIYDYVVTDALPATVPVHGRAYDYTRSGIVLSTVYRVAGGSRLEVGVDAERFEREHQDRRSTQTRRVWLEFGSRIAGVSEIVVDVFEEQRDGSDYETDVDAPAPENPLMRKYNLADRRRSGAQLRGAWFGGARADFGVEIELGNDRYPDSAIGLGESDYRRFTADFSYLFTDDVSIHGSYDNERYTVDQASSQSFSAPDWTATTDDRFETATVGAAHASLLGRLEAGLELVWADSTGRIRTETQGLESRFPALTSDRRVVSLTLAYPYSESLKIGFSYHYEKMRSDDWALDGVGVATVPGLMALGASAWNYSGSAAYFSVRYELLPF